MASREAAEIEAELGVQKGPDKELSSDYNVAPTKAVYLVADRRAGAETTSQDMSKAPIEGAVEREMIVARWGLVPSWAKDRKIGNRMINARAETVAEKPAFRRAFAKRRCLIPADGYYEWYRPTGTSKAPRALADVALDTPEAKGKKPHKQPFYIHSTDGALLTMAGLYEWWADPAVAPDDPKRWLCSMTILTTESRGELAEIHHRMPLFVAETDWDAWLDPGRPGRELGSLMKDEDVDWLRADPVSTAVNSVRNNGPELLNPLPPS